MSEPQATFVDCAHPPGAEQLRLLAGDSRLINVGWVTPVLRPEVLNLRAFASESDGAVREAYQLFQAAECITRDWLAWHKAGPDGVRAGQLVEDPLIIQLQEVAKFASAVRAYLEESRIRRLTLAGPRRTPWLHWAAAIARSLKVSVAWDSLPGVANCLRAAAEATWPLASPVVLAALETARWLGRPFGRKERVNHGNLLIVTEGFRHDLLNTYERTAAELQGTQDWLLPWNPEQAQGIAQWLEERGLHGLRLRDCFGWGSASRELSYRLKLAWLARGEISRLIQKHLATKLYAQAPFASVLAECRWRLTPRAEGLRSAATQLLRERQTSVILLLSDYNFVSRIVVAAARALNIPTVQLQHGVCYTSEEIYGLPVLSDHVAVWDRYHADWYAAHGVPTEKIRLTGNPRYDCLSEPIPAEQQLLPGQGPLLLVITDWMPTAETARFLTGVLHAVRGLRVPPRVLIKTHPCEDPVSVQQLLTDWEGIAVSVQRHGDSVCLVRQADLVVMVSSTVGYEALLAGSPVVLTAFPGFHRFRHDSATPFLVANDEQEMAGHVRAVLEDTTYARQCRERSLAYAREYWPCCGAGAARRVAEFLTRLAPSVRLTNQGSRQGRTSTAGMTDGMQALSP